MTVEGTRVDTQALQQRVQEQAELLRKVRDGVAQIIVGQEQMVEGLLTGMLAGGHVLIEGVPGLAKTLTVQTLAQTLRSTFHRIQFTPDLLPSDLIGTMIFEPGKGTFSVRKGPIFANIILADEINRAPAKVQSALLEAMQERQVTIGDETHVLEEPFLVLATQNPIEQEGTYPLPEAQVDRFMLKLVVTYPDKAGERAILDRMTGHGVPTVEPVVSPEELLAARKVVRDILVEEPLRDYIVNLVVSMREPELYGLNLKGLIAYGASPRATINLTLAAKANAFLRGSYFATPDDVKAVAYNVLRHRVILTYEAEAEEVTADQIVREVLSSVDVP